MDRIQGSCSLFLSSDCVALSLPDANHAFSRSLGASARSRSAEVASEVDMSTMPSGIGTKLQNKTCSRNFLLHIRRNLRTWLDFGGMHYLFLIIIFRIEIVYLYWLLRPFKLLKYHHLLFEQLWQGRNVPGCEEGRASEINFFFRTQSGTQGVVQNAHHQFLHERVEMLWWNRIYEVIVYKNEICRHLIIWTSSGQHCLILSKIYKLFKKKFQFK